MSKADILEEIPKLTPTERDEIRCRIDELNDPLSAEEWALIDGRMEAHRRDPGSGIPVEQMVGDLRGRFRR